MKKSIFAIGLALMVMSCTTEELADNANETSTESQVAAKVADQAIKFSNPINVSAGSIIQGGTYREDTFPKAGGGYIGNNFAAYYYINGYVYRYALTQRYPRAIFAQRFYEDQGQGYVKLSNQQSDQVDVGPIANANRWYKINGEFYFMALGSPSYTEDFVTWYRVEEGKPNNTKYLEQIEFVNGVAQDTRVNTSPSRDPEYHAQVVRAVIAANNGTTTPNPTPTTPKGPNGYTFAAKEGGTVAISSGTYNIAYGANGKFNFLENVTRNTPCNNATFRDPIGGTKKNCFVQKVTTTAPTPTPTPPTGGICDGVPAYDQNVDYQNGDQYVLRERLYEIVNDRRKYIGKCN